MKVFEIEGDGQDTLCVSKIQIEDPFVRIQNVTRNGSHEKPWFGDRAQTRALIETLRQAEAEMRTGQEVIIRKRLDGCAVYALGLTPGDVHETLLASWIQNAPFDEMSRARAELWWAETSADLRARGLCKPFASAPVTFIGFDD